MKTLRCPRCTVTHRVQNPVSHRANLCRCEAPRCGLQFWQASDSLNDGKIIMAIAEDNAQQWLDAGCIMEERDEFDAKKGE